MPMGGSLGGAMRRARRRCAAGAGAVRNPRGGQKTAEFAILVGTVAVAVLSMMPFVQQVLRGGVLNINERMLNQPLTNALPNFATNDTTKEFEVSAKQTIDEQGFGDFSRTTNFTSTVSGRSVNEDARLRRFED